MSENGAIFCMLFFALLEEWAQALLTALVRGQFVRGSHERRRPFLLIILATLKLFFSKIWASKNCVEQFFRCVVRADFFEATKVGRKSSEFFEP